MYTLTTKACFDSAHFLSGYQGKCANIHGHRWTVEIEMGAGELHEDGNIKGMVVDFSTLKDDLRSLTDYLDHCLIIERGTLKEKTMEALNEEGFRVVEMEFRPTAENFARYFFDRLEERRYKNLRVTVYETPNNCAKYYRD